MKIYGSMGSPYVVRVVLAAAVKGLNAPLTAPPGGGIKSPEYLAINPLGKMPALEDNGRHLIESMVILDYFEDAYPQKPLLPANHAERARIRTLARLSDTYLAPQLGPLFRQLNPATRNQADVDAVVAGVRRVLGDIDKFVDPKGPFLAGPTVTQADCAFAPSLNTLTIVLGMFGVNDPLTSAPNVARWWKMIQSDPQFGPVLKQQADAFRAFMAAPR